MASMLRAAALGRRGMAGGARAIAPIAPGAPLFPRPTGMMARLKGALGASANALPPSYKVDRELLQEAPTEVTSLPNGVRVATQKRPTGSASVGVYIDAGSRFEPAPGVAHVAHRLIAPGGFGTPPPQALADQGVVFETSATREMTSVLARGRSADTSAMIKGLTASLASPDVSEAAVGAAKEAAATTAGAISPTPEEEVMDNLHSWGFQGTTLARPVVPLPSEGGVAGVTPADVSAYVADNFQPHRLVIAAAGEVDHALAVAAVTEALGSLPSNKAGTSSVDAVKAAPAFLTGSDIRVRDDYKPSAQFAVAFESCGAAHPDAPAFLVLQALLGEWHVASTTGGYVSNRLANALDDLPNAVSFSTFNLSYTDTGLFGIRCAGTAPELDDVAYSVMHELVRPAFKISSAALAAAKAALTTRVLGAHNTTADSVATIGRELHMFGRAMPVAEWIARLDAVDAPVINRIVSKYIYDREIAVSAIHNTYTLPDLTWLRRRTFHNTF
eukprot:TRINITY_DN1013_c0_g1_i11.p1 TRINITY_DN1013_c0_g1~~TRINITY_DN1013_c0_g1_i11.p1  ORF type:complete len:544 (-),score=147.98 TRINITY_DN1013_c0_g1_i11:239-1744(-)